MATLPATSSFRSTMMPFCRVPRRRHSYYQRTTTLRWINFSSILQERNSWRKKRRKTRRARSGPHFLVALQANFDLGHGYFKYLYMDLFDSPMELHGKIHQYWYTGLSQFPSWRGPHCVQIQWFKSGPNRPAVHGQVYICKPIGAHGLPVPCPCCIFLAWISSFRRDGEVFSGQRTDKCGISEILWSIGWVIQTQRRKS